MEFVRNKTCGECRYHDKDDHCSFFGFTRPASLGVCRNFQQLPSNGDKIRQMSNEGIAAFVCGVLNDRREETFRCVLDLLNAPAESEGKDE